MIIKTEQRSCHVAEEEKICPDDKIDLRGVLCPINFVKTKLKLEMLDSGQVLEVILDDGEPMRSVPKSVKEEGHKIIKVENMGTAYRILIKKT
ncbi:MAG: sulfurtransferase TusA family protein [Candidatus Brocadiaceae bacterium]|nr:sulfurtransferase TusA family protein [Candidatus Brocadiaceae bacterium]